MSFKNNTFIFMILLVMCTVIFTLYLYIHANNFNIISTVSIENIEHIQSMHSIDHIHSYWTDSSIPTFEQLQEELLCSINKNNPKYAIYKKLLSHIYQLQFKQSSDQCYNDPSTKYYIIENPCPGTGLFAGLRCWIAYFSESIFRNRTFLFHGKYNFAPNTYCENVTNNDTNNMECYFLPISSCNNITHLLFQQIHGKIDNTTILIYGEQKYIP
eukprot:383507_1